jgi:PEP-CTERM motif-containing protein
MMKNLSVLGCVLFFSTFVFAGTVTVDFETDGIGTPTFSGENIDGIYANLGAIFTNGFIFECGGGCPPPAFGHFAAPPGTRGGMTVLFSVVQSSINFDNVSFSSVTANAYDTMGNLVASVTDTSGVNVDFVTLSAAAFVRVDFVDGANLGGQHGIDDLTFTSTPEPSSLALLGSGILGVMSLARYKMNF